jgi:hypothetical protein
MELHSIICSVCRPPSLLTRKFALFNVNVPATNSALAGERLFVNLDVHSALPPWTLKLSIRRIMKLRLPPREQGPHATAQTAPGSVDSRADGSTTGTQHDQAGQAGVEQILSHQPQQPHAAMRAVTVANTVQKFVAFRPFSSQFEGAFYIVVPQRCCTFTSDIADVKYELKVKLTFGMGRAMTHVVPLTVRHWLADVARCVTLTTQVASLCYFALLLRRKLARFVSGA